MCTHYWDFFKRCGDTVYFGLYNCSRFNKQTGVCARGAAANKTREVDGYCSGHEGNHHN